MEKIKINEIPTLVKNGELSLKKACNRIWEDIYFKKNWYNLKNLNEDQISDFLLDSQKKFPQIINSYNPGTLEFRCYVYSCIHFLKIKWLKKYFEKQEEEKNIEYVIKGENCLAAEPTSLQDEVFEMPKTEQNQQTETKAESKKIKIGKTRSFDSRLQIMPRNRRIAHLKSCQFHRNGHRRT
ncbi:hypothetical protein [Treponema zioleckii]|uniref:hypothetical protein n=1 Tax=Treponema zioleckii TaxID=331680 RepID=UPI00168A884A|nr:hypothetical protein [Treponema zioleckii]